MFQSQRNGLTIGLVDQRNILVNLGNQSWCQAGDRLVGANDLIPFGSCIIVIQVKMGLSTPVSMALIIIFKALGNGLVGGDLKTGVDGCVNLVPPCVGRFPVLQQHFLAYHFGQIGC